MKTEWIKKLEASVIAANVGALQASLSHLLYATSKCEEIWSRFNVGSKEEFDKAVKYISETTARGTVESAYYVVRFYQVHGFYPNELKRFKENK